MSPEARRSLVLPTILATLTLAVLLSLGTWQWRRLVWKEGLIAALKERTTAAPIPLADALRRLRAGEDVEYVRARAAGRWRHADERFLWSPGRDGPGWDVVTPLALADGSLLLVNRGFIADGDRERARRPEPAADGEVTVTGLVRRPSAKAMFDPANDAGGNRWYWRDLDGMARSFSAADAARVLPVFLDAEARTPAEASASPRSPRGGATRLDLPNSHLQYAVTWYGLALTLIGVYLAFVRQRLRTDKRS